MTTDAFTYEQHFNVVAETEIQLNYFFFFYIFSPLQIIFIEYLYFINSSYVLCVQP